KHPSPADLAQAVGRIPSGHFMASRFGLSSNILVQLASTRPEDTDAVYQRAEEIRQQTGVEHYSASVLSAALIQQYEDWERLLAQIHLDGEDLMAGVRWQQHVRDLIANLSKPRRTGGIARDWSFGYIPLLTRFGQNISRVSGKSFAVDIS